MKTRKFSQLAFNLTVALTAISFALVSPIARAQNHVHGHDHDLPHMDLELTSEEYWELVKHLTLTESNDPLVAIVNIGKRNLDWIAHINSLRPADRKLELSNPALQTGISIDAPSTSSRSLVLAQWEEVKTLMDPAVKSVLLDSTDFTNDPPQTDEDFMIVARKVDRAYQRAARWLGQEPALARYAERASADVRGFYHLGKEPNLDGKLRNWNSQTVEDRQKLKVWLIGQCLNAYEIRSVCESKFASSIQPSGNAVSYYNLYRAAAQEHWNSFFEIPTYRTDVVWTPADTNTMRIPFQTPERPEVLNWLRDNIEDEWKWSNWKLKLDFQNSTSQNMTRIRFVAGATPNVNRLAGNIITMDANRDINEYSSKWTIRHEYGHVLGFPDCYLEFYDEPAGVMVNYQLDVDNLMCSRKGHLQEKHFDELKRAYFN